MAKNEYGEKLDSNGYAPSILSKSPWCHQNGVTAVHTNREADLRLKKWAQKKAMEYYGWPEARFIQEFGRSYL